MTLKRLGYRRDYLFWIYPLIYLGLTVLIISWNKLQTEPSIRRDFNVNVDSIVINQEKVLVNNLLLNEFDDRALTFLAMNK
jgi:hypothetical protein